MSDKEHYLWTEIYRPKTIEECILVDRLKRTFQSTVNEGQISNMLLIGGPGTGKSTVARALCEQMGIEYDFINASKDGNIDTLRNRISGFVNTVSLISDTKVVILDEADYLNAQSTQPALRSFIETTSKHSRFIMTANFPNRIIDPLRSRLDVIDFNPTVEERKKLAPKILKRLFEILTERDIEFSKKAVAELVKKHLPDFRKMLSELQSHARSMGRIDESILDTISGENVDGLLHILKDPKRLVELREWVAEHKDYDFSQLLASVKEPVYENVADGQAFFEATEIMQDANKWSTFVPDMELHILNMFVLLMGIDWKK